MSESAHYENVPAAEVTYGLTLDEAAKRMAISPAYFRTTMTKLNKTGNDLRTPAQPGERARKYDLAKLDAWKAAGMPVPKDSLRVPETKPGAREVAATATRQGNHWVVTIKEIHQDARTDNLRNAQRIAHAMTVQALDVAPDEVAINLTIELPTDAAQKWDQAKRQDAQVREAAQLAAQLSRQVVRELKAQGCTYQDIGELLGITKQRAQQLNHTAG